MALEIHASPTPLFTIGYEGHPVSDLTRALTGARVKIVVDTRWTATSRNQAYRKNALKCTLEAQGIEYRHYRALGSPPEMRAKLYAGETTYQEFFWCYASYAMLQDEINVLCDLLEQGTRLCLLCMEKDPHRCHRSELAELLAGSVNEGSPLVSVHHLLSPAQDGKQEEQAPISTLVYCHCQDAQVGSETCSTCAIGPNTDTLGVKRLRAMMDAGL